MYSDNNGFTEILNRLLSNVDDGLDKREGSIIYDALAPAAAELAQCYIALDVYEEQTYLLTATGESLDKRVAEAGVTRIQATPAQVKISVYDSNGVLMSVGLDNRFAVPNEFGGYTYKLLSEESEGIYLAECETVGQAGGSYMGDLLPLQSINNLGNAIITSIPVPGEDEETDTTLRNRTLEKLNQEAFAGNKAAYRQMLIEQNGVEDCKVFPVWHGGGTVKVVPIGPNHTLLDADAISTLQNKIDPTPQGTGIGLAPIGHTVTVESPTADNLSITATLELEEDATISQIQGAVTEQIENYIYQVQNDFISKDLLIVYLAKVSAAILNVKEIKNVRALTINGVAADYEIDNSIPASISDTHVVKYPILPENGVTLIEYT